MENGDAHLKNSGVIYQHLKQYHLGQLPLSERRLAPVFDIVSTTPYIANDTMALSLTGSKRWPKWKVLQRFARQHCDLSNSKIATIVDEVYNARDQVLPLLTELTNKHPDFESVAEKINVALAKGF